MTDEYPEFLLRTHDKHRDGNDLVFPVAAINAYYPEVYRDGGPLAGGLFRRSVGTGKFDKRQVVITDASGHVRRSLLTNEGLKPVLRRIQTVDVEAVATLDARIADLSAQLAATQSERRAALAYAFTHGGRLLPQEVAAVADAALTLRGGPG